MEIEFESLPREAIEPIKQRWRCKVADDRTVRGKTYLTSDGVPIRLQRRSRDNNDDGDDEDGGGAVIRPSGVREGNYIGLEVVTEPYEEDVAMQIAEFVSRMYGHIPQTSNTSVHIHVDVGGKRWVYIQNVIRWVYHLEMPLLRMAAAGGKHRGGRYDRQDGGDAYNDYRFTRPLSAPIAAAYPRAARPVLDIPSLLAAKSASEMMAYWGRMDIMSTDGDLRGSHYVPHRLHMLNLLAVMRQGTLEWRMFDGVYKRIPDFLRLVMRIHAIAETATPDFAPMLLGSTPPAYLNAEWLSHKLGMDVTRLWGGGSSSSGSSYSGSGVWPSPVKNPLRLHHYQNFGWSIPTLAQVPVVPYMSNMGVYDDGSASFVPYRRR
jgi:hypothetical protein